MLFYIMNTLQRRSFVDATTVHHWSFGLYQHDFIEAHCYADDDQYFSSTPIWYFSFQWNRIPYDCWEYQYLNFTRWDISFNVNKLSQFMHRSTDVHWQVVKHLVQYLADIKDHGIFFVVTTRLLFMPSWLVTDDYTSTSAHIVYIDAHSVSWTSKKQKLWLALPPKRSIRDVDDAVVKFRWVILCLHKLGVSSVS